MKFKDLIEGKVYVIKDSGIHKYELKEGLLWNKTTNEFSADPVRDVAKWRFEEFEEHYTFDQAKKDCMETGQKYVVMGNEEPIITMEIIDGDVILFSLMHGFGLGDEWTKAEELKNKSYSLYMQGEEIDEHESLVTLYDFIIFKEKGLLIYDETTMFEIEDMWINYKFVESVVESGKPFAISQKYIINKID